MSIECAITEAEQQVVRRLRPRFLDDGDLRWLRPLVTEFERFDGRRLRELQRRLKEPFPWPMPRAKYQAAARVLTRKFKGRSEISRKEAANVRRSVFRAAARLNLEHASGASVPSLRLRREAVFQQVGDELGIAAEEVRKKLFADFPEEASLRAPAETLDLRKLVLEINRETAESFLRKARFVRIWLCGGARDVVRIAKFSGLICTVSAVDDVEYSVLLEISGPLALFRHTGVYASALTRLLPFLARCARFRLEAYVQRRRAAIEHVVIESSDPLPAAPDDARKFDSRLEQNFAKDFARLALDYDLVREPEPIVAGQRLMFPDFAVWHRTKPTQRFYVEIVGYWTEGYLRDKLEALRTCDVRRLIVCVDERLNCGSDIFPEGLTVVPFSKRVDAGAVLEIVKSATDDR